MKNQQSVWCKPVKKSTAFFIIISALAIIAGGLYLYDRQTNVLGAQTTNGEIVSPWSSLLALANPLALLTTTTTTTTTKTYSCTTATLNPMTCPVGFSCTATGLSTEGTCKPKKAVEGEGCGGSANITCNTGLDCVGIKVTNTTLFKTLNQLINANVYKGICVKQSTVQGCSYQNVLYQKGTQFRNSCNTCTCSTAGTVTCTTKVCAVTPTPTKAAVSTVTPSPSPTPAAVIVTPTPITSAEVTKMYADFETGTFQSLTGSTTAEGPNGAYFGKGVYSDIKTVATPAMGAKSAALTIGSGSTTAAYLFTYSPVVPATSYGKYTAWYYVPSTITPSDWWNIWQWKSYSTTYDKPIFTLNLVKNNGVLQLRFAYVPGGTSANATQNIWQTSPIAFPTDTWVKIEGYYYASATATGFAQVYQNGVKILEKTNVMTKPGGQKVLWSVNSYADAISPNPATIYIDNMSIKELPTP